MTKTRKKKLRSNNQISETEIKTSAVYSRGFFIEDRRLKKWIVEGEGDKGSSGDSSIVGTQNCYPEHFDILIIYSFGGKRNEYPESSNQ